MFNPKVSAKTNSSSSSISKMNLFLSEELKHQLSNLSGLKYSKLFLFADSATAHIAAQGLPMCLCVVKHKGVKTASNSPCWHGIF